MAVWFNMEKYFLRGCNTGGKNTIVDIKKVDTGSEPVAIEDIQDHIINYNTDDNALLLRYAKASRIAIENFTGVSIRPKDITAILDNFGGEMELPYGPVNGDVEVLYDNEDGDEIEDAVIGVEYKRLSQNNGRVYVSYESGFEVIPEDLILAILAETAYRYENRGENNADIKYETQAMSSGLSEQARDLAMPYKRTVSIL